MFRLLYRSLCSSLRTGLPRLWNIRIISTCQVSDDVPCGLAELIERQPPEAFVVFLNAGQQTRQAFAILELGFPPSVRFQKGFPVLLDQNFGILNAGPSPTTPVPCEFPARPFAVNSGLPPNTLDELPTDFVPPEGGQFRPTEAAVDRQQDQQPFPRCCVPVESYELVSLVSVNLLSPCLCGELLGQQTYPYGRHFIALGLRPDALPGAQRRNRRKIFTMSRIVSIAIGLPRLVAGRFVQWARISSIFDRVRVDIEKSAKCCFCKST